MSAVDTRLGTVRTGRERRPTSRPGRERRPTSRRGHVPGGGSVKTWQVVATPLIVVASIVGGGAVGLLLLTIEAAMQGLVR